MTQSLSLPHLARLPLKATSAPPLLLLLHGVGSNEHDLFGIASQLDERFVVLSARAPHPRGPGGYAWFAVTFTPQGPVIDPQQAEASREALIQFIGEATESYNTDPRQVYLMGFSQGAIMSASVALTKPERVAGAVLMSGRILPEIRPSLAAPAQLADLPILVIHGTNDTVLPIHHGRDSRNLLGALPVQLDYHEYPMGHEITPQSLATAAAWLRGRLDGDLLKTQN